LSTPGYVPEPRAQILIPEPKPDAVEPAARDIDIVVTSKPAPTEEAAAAPAPDVLEQMAPHDNLVGDRYSLLRNLLAQ